VRRMPESRIVVYGLGIAHASVCAPKYMTEQEIEADVNASHPTGISSPWKVSEDNFKTGHSNPCPCEYEPEGYLHYLMVC